MAHQVIERGGSKLIVMRAEQTLNVTFPETFSLLDNPDGALEFLDVFRSQFSKRFIKRLHFDHSRCSHLGLDAQAIVDALVDEEAIRRQGHPLFVGGTYPTDQGTKIMLKAIGTLRSLRHPESALPADIEKRIERCDRIYGNGKDVRENAARDRAGTAIVDYFDRVLHHSRLQLTPDSQGALTTLVTEVIGNAEEHSGRWYAIGYSYGGKKADKQGQLDECQIALFNFGRTIFESLSARSSSTEIKKRIETLVEEHRKAGNFNEQFDDECVWTLAALQRGVSRYKKGVRGATRGKGTIEMLRAFKEIATAPYKMAVISGNTYIGFDDAIPYEIDTSKQIAFNSAGDMATPPDARYVHKLMRHFPGTIISLRFLLDSEHLQARVK